MIMSEGNRGHRGPLYIIKGILMEPLKNQWVIEYDRSRIHKLAISEDTESHHVRGRDHPSAIVCGSEVLYGNQRGIAITPFIRVLSLVFQDPNHSESIAWGRVLKPLDHFYVQPFA